jgi:CheY-like chemotaxis protein
MARILVAGDNPRVVVLVADMLRAFQYSVEVAPSTANPLDAVRHSQPAALVLDIDEAGGRGMSFIRACRSQPDCRQLPIAAVIARPGLVDNARDAPPLVTVRKPFRMAHLLRALRTLLPHGPACR